MNVVPCVFGTYARRFMDYVGTCGLKKLCLCVCVGPGDALLAEPDLWLAVIDSWAARLLLPPPTALCDACHTGQSVQWSDSYPDTIACTHCTHTHRLKSVITHRHKLRFEDLTYFLNVFYYNVTKWKRFTVIEPTEAAMFTHWLAATISSKNNTVGMMGPLRRSC